MSYINAAAAAASHSAAHEARNAGCYVQPIAVRPQSSGMGGRPIVVIVDGDPAVCSALKFSLELEGFGVRAYGSAAELLNADDLAACDCFVIDQRMPGMSGMELIAKLRDLKLKMPAILLISHPNPVVRAFAAKAEVPIVEKPLLGDALLESIRDACGRGS